MIDRFHKEVLLEMLQVFPVVAVIGPRQVRNRPLLRPRLLVGDRTYLILDDISLRTHDQLEIDGVIQSGRTEMLYEIKASRTVSARDARSMERWMALREKDSIGTVIYAGERYTALSTHVRAIPTSFLFGNTGNP